MKNNVEIFIVVRGDMVQEVYCSDKAATVTILDYDAPDADVLDAVETAGRELDRRAVSKELTCVY